MFWSTIQDFTDPKPVKVNVDLTSLATEFENRMRIPDTLPPDFDRIALELAALESSAIPTITVDPYFKTLLLLPLGSGGYQVQ